MSYLYDCLTRYGDVSQLRSYIDPSQLAVNLQQFDNSWVQYNPRKNLPRYGLSITSFDGGLSGVPDLDSIKEYNQKMGTSLDELDFNQKTTVWPAVEPVLQTFESFLGRTHLIKMAVGGCFPTHRDQYFRELNSFRLFVPIFNCNPPFSHFILDNRVLTFEHGHAYFINTCKEHTLFTTIDESLFVVANLEISESSVDAVLQDLFIS